MQKRKRRNERGLFALALVFGTLFPLLGSAQIYLPQHAPEPSEYGKVVLDNYAGAEPGPVVFDHWLHRSKFTCRVCHVDIGFAMTAKATGISARSNREGFHCGVCHDGKRQFEGRTVFEACSNTPASPPCYRCHLVGKKDARKYHYKEFVAKFPKGIYGVDWMAAEKSGAVRPVDFIEGVSARTPRMQDRKDLLVEPRMPWIEPIIFSHEKHSFWNGCELCHPEIFPVSQKAATHLSMFANIQGKYCGACHGKVAFPLNTCQGCHPRGPSWVR